jgi:DNA-binding FadR family transcriptional regulator
MQQLRVIKPHSIHEDVQHQIREYILMNKLKPGDTLPTEVQFSEQLGVSRTAIREALRSLESMGVIHSRQGEGRFVSPFTLDPVIQNLAYSMLSDVEDVRELLIVRERLELSFVGDAIAAMDDATLTELRRLMEQIQAKGQADETFVSEDLGFHRAIYRVIGNQLLLKLLDIFWDVYRNLRDQSLQSVHELGVQARNHQEILSAIETRDVPRAQKAIIDHFDEINGRLSLRS